MFEPYVARAGLSFEVQGLHKSRQREAFLARHFLRISIHTQLVYFSKIFVTSKCLNKTSSVHSNAHKVIAGFFLSPDPEVT
jgi:hypothetical protein